MTTEAEEIAKIAWAHFDPQLSHKPKQFIESLSLALVAKGYTKQPTSDGVNANDLSDHRREANRMAGILGLELSENETTEAVLKHCCNRMVEAGYLLKQTAKAYGQ